jgi:uncharacterized MnhB-related membrane protein
MNNDMSWVNMLIIAGMVISAIVTVAVKDTLSTIIAMGAVGSFVALEFLFLHAPDVAIAEGAVGAVLTPVIFIITLRKVKGGIEE